MAKRFKVKTFIVQAYPVNGGEEIHSEHVGLILDQDYNIVQLNVNNCNTIRMGPTYIPTYDKALAEAIAGIFIAHVKAVAYYLRVGSKYHKYVKVKDVIPKILSNKTKVESVQYGLDSFTTENEAIIFCGNLNDSKAPTFFLGGRI